MCINIVCEGLVKWPCPLGLSKSKSCWEYVPRSDARQSRWSARQRSKGCHLVVICKWLGQWQQSGSFYCLYEISTFWLTCWVSRQLDKPNFSIWCWFKATPHGAHLVHLVVCLPCWIDPMEWPSQVFFLCHWLVSCGCGCLSI
jgi:hypothetical protein